MATDELLASIADARSEARRWRPRQHPAKLRAHPRIESDLLRVSRPPGSGSFSVYDGQLYRAQDPVEFGSTLRAFGLLVVSDFYLPTGVLRILADDDTLLWDSRMVRR